MCGSFQDIVNQLESMRIEVFDADMSSDPARRTVYTARLINLLFGLFLDYESKMSITAGRGMPDRNEGKY
jgi:hypothetical protein